jgi:hypothetical protein
MPYKEGRKWRGVATINEKHIASQALFLSKIESREWEIISNSIPDTLLSKSTKTQYYRSRAKLHTFFNYCITLYYLGKNIISVIERLPGSSLPLSLQESRVDLTPS